MSEAARRATDQTALDVDRLRADFPALERRVRDQALVYLDNAATALTPRPVLDAMDHYYRQCNANIHRGVHTMSEEATELFERGRDTTQRFINAAHREEIVFTRGTTEAINLVAQAWARPRVKPGDEILITHMEHHSNIVPWQLVCEQTGATLKVIPITETGELDMEAAARMIGERTKLVGVVHVSNSLGTINPVDELVRLAHERDVPVLVDGSQALPHRAVDVRALDCDFYVGTGHKVYGPSGTGFLYGKASILQAMPPWHGGGDMISSVRFEKTTYKGLPYKFEAGTPNIAGVIGLAEALRYTGAVGPEKIAARESELREYGERVLARVPGLRMIGTAADKVALFSFVMDGIHPHDLGTIVDHAGVAIRTGHHCTMPVMEFFRVPATARASLAFYNTFEEIDRLADALEQARGILGR